MEEWIVIDFLNETVEKCTSEDKAVAKVQEWMEDGFDVSKTKVYKVVEKYTVDVEVHLRPTKRK